MIITFLFIREVINEPSIFIQLAALDRKITAELKPSDAEEAARAKVVTPTKRQRRATR